MLRLRVLGGFALQGPDEAPVPALPNRRATAVLAVLAVCGKLGCTRERLLALLWPESDEAHARHGLRDALQAIRHTLTPSSIPSAASQLHLDPVVVGSDVGEFVEAMASGRLADAVRAYGGPLLEGFHVDGAPEFERWLDGERARLAREFAWALERLAASAEGAGDWTQAAGWWGRAVEHDPPNSHFVLHQMRAMSVIGDRANAVQAGEHHVRQLREEFDLEPDPAVLALVGQIRRGELPAPSNGAARLLAVAGPPQPAAEVQADHHPAGPLTSDWKPALTRPRSVRVSGRLVSLAGIIAVVAVVAAIRTALWPRIRAADVRPSRAVIAVLPFQNLSWDTSQAYFAVGLHDELLTQLARVSSLKVIGSASVTGYGQTSKPVAQIGQELGVGSIVQASVQVLRNRLRVIVQLIDPATDAHLWGETYDRTLNDAFAYRATSRSAS